MNYSETIAYLYETLPMFSHMGSAAFKKDLINIRLLCTRLGNPQEKFRTIHVGGTNGKGSVCHMLAAILQTAGFKTGLYTSPHLYDFRERIKVNGLMADQDFVVGFVEKIRPAIETIRPSFFEITVAMAFDYFHREKVDIAIIEVGLGGRLDSTNIITPELSVITNIGWDHMNILGNTLEAIAMEKAGIIKPGVPVVIGEKKPETAGLFSLAATENKAPLFFASDRFAVSDYLLSNDIIKIRILDRDKQKSTDYELDLPGIYQTMNLCTVLQALALLPGMKPCDAVVQEALKEVKARTGLHGRWEVIHRDPTVILEVAHNPDGMLQMLDHLNRIGYRQLHMVIGMVKDKDINQVLRILPPTALYYFTQAQIPRALDAISLRDQASRYSLKGSDYPEVNLAISAALERALPEDLVLVCGSIFLVAEVSRESVSELS